MPELRTPPSLISALADTHAGPLFFYKVELDGKTYEFYHTLDQKHLIGINSNEPYKLLCDQGKMYLILEGVLWLLNRDLSVQVDSLPINARRPILITPAYYYKNPYLYIYGRSQSKTNQAILLRVKISELLIRNR